MSKIYKIVDKLYEILYPKRHVLYGLLAVTSFVLILLRLLFYDQSLYVFLQKIPDFIRFERVNTSGLRAFVGELSLDPRSIHKLLWYRLYFIVDLAFPILLFAACILVQKVVPKRALCLLGIAFVATALDWTENFSFLAFNVRIELLQTLQILKFIAYGFFFGVWFYNIYQRYFKQNAGHYFRGLSASVLSILLAVIFSILMTSMDQGTSLVIEMLMSPWNFIFFYLLIVFGSIIISHYPRFIFEFLFPTSTYEWKLNWRGVFPIIYFNSNKKSEKDYEKLVETLGNLKAKIDSNTPGLTTELVNLQAQSNIVNQKSGFNINKNDFAKLQEKIMEIDETNPVSLTTSESSIIELEHLVETLDPSKQKDLSKQIFTFIRHYLGSFIILSIIYVLLYTYLKVFYEKPGLFATQFTILLGIVVIWFQNYLFRLERSCISASKKLEKVHQVRTIKDTDPDLLKEFKKENKETFKKTRRIFLLLNFLIIIQFVMIIVRFFMEHEWHRYNVAFAILQFIFMLLGYIVFREYRSILKYRYYLSSGYKNKSKSPEPLVNDGGIYLQEVLSKPFFIPLSKKMQIIGNFSNNEFFILVSILITLLIFTVAVGFSLFNTVALNAASYLLAYILLYYGLIIFVLKGIFYAERISESSSTKAGNSDEKKSSSTAIASYGGLLILGVMIYGFVRGNDLHLLRDIDEQSKHKIGLDDFRSKIPTAPLTGPDSLEYKSIFSVASFGGGLKANYYTLKVLNKIQRETNGEFMRSTISLSGVSGGGVGLANYYLLDGFTEAVDMDKKIKDIGQLNILSIDCSYLMFQDFWREILPCFKYTDRSYRGMMEYKKVILDDIEAFDQMSYRDVYKDILENKGTYPSLLMNSTSTKLQYGIASSIESVTLPGAIDILDIRVYDDKENELPKSLTFYDAVSTVNRFPIFSPAAEITNKGHFVDGGYFENSGMLSSLSLLDRLGYGNWAVHEKMKLPQGDRNVVMINLINSKTHWINHILQEVYDKNDYIRKGAETTEITAIINTVGETEMLPNYFIQLLKQKTRDSLSKFTFIPIYMPFTVHYEDIVEYLKGEPAKTMELLRYLDEKNEEIMSILSDSDTYDYEAWGLVEPALSRNLSEPDRIYQDVMIDKHPYIQMQVDKIKSMMYK